MSVSIELHVLNGIIRHAWDVFPCECCGLLAGKDNVINEYIRTRNIRESEVAYEIDPEEHIAVRKRLRMRGSSVLGAYHSHPRSAASPSPRDVAEAHYDKEFSYVIVSLERQPPDVRAYRLEKGVLIEAPFEV